jgi:hypothetical protein
VKHRSHSLQRKAYICELAGSAAWLRSPRRPVRVIVAVAPFVRQIAVSALFEPSVRAQTVPQAASIRNDGLRRGGHAIAGQRAGEHAAVTAGVHFFGGRRPCLLSGGRTVTDIRFALEALQHDHEAKTFGFDY